MSLSDEEDFNDIYGDENTTQTTVNNNENQSSTSTSTDNQNNNTQSNNQNIVSNSSKDDQTDHTSAFNNEKEGDTVAATSQLDQLAALQALSSNLSQLQQQVASSNTKPDSDLATTNDKPEDNANSNHSAPVPEMPQMPQMPQMPGMPDMSQLQQLQQTMSQLQQTASQHEPKAIKADLSRDINKMFIGGLNWETTEDGLRDYFSKYGAVAEVKIMKDTATGRSRGFGFLTFESASSVDEVVKTQHILDGKVIDPKRAIPREEQDKTGKIFVGGIGPDVRPKEFEEFFSQWGSIIDAQLMLDKDTGRSRGFGFITYDTPDAVDRVCQNKFIEFKGKQIEIKRAEPRQLQKQKQPQITPPMGQGVSNPMQQYQMFQNPMMAGGFNPMMAGGFNPNSMNEYYTKMQEYYQQMQQQTGIDYTQMFQQQMQQMQQMMGMMGGLPAGQQQPAQSGAGSPPSHSSTPQHNDDSNGVTTIGSSNNGNRNNSGMNSGEDTRYDNSSNRDDSRRSGQRSYDRGSDRSGYGSSNRDRDSRRGPSSNYRGGGSRDRDSRRGGSGSGYGNGGRDRRGYHPYAR
ncbi:unnamed protein product [Kluyveromyces dobzhanskii CBS 2104]|uniref:WGS project CCBQ000000000 data, contig 00015 n=1 Tax=Kluyveromyces dobzhanskii CBS 2104 TaxID=1427455 RepID=A0A0A8LAY7_9SACH|nr:unnamed protein product [Kluyveromyces dobzhanskii CBS 2104]